MTVPNILSLLRLFLVPVFAVVFFQPMPDAHTWAALIYLVAFLTDIADGWIARHFNQVSKLGRILDPAADKWMTFTVIICIMFSYFLLKGYHSFRSIIPEITESTIQGGNIINEEN